MRATVVAAGAGLRELHGGPLPLLDPYDPDELCPGAHGQLLIPWPNRIDRGRYTFDGEDHQLTVNEPSSDTAIHGLVRWDAWQLDEHGPSHARLSHRLLGRPGYPFVLDLSADYTLDADEGLTVTVTATNAGSRPAPFGHGAHPYLTVGEPTLDGCSLTVPGATRLPIDERALPIGKEPVDGTPYDFRRARRIGETWLDHAYTDLQRDGAGYAWTHLSAPGGATTVSLWVDQSYGWLQLFTGDGLPQPGRRRTALGVEPMSCPPNAFNTGEGVTTLEPGETSSGRWGITCTGTG